MNDTNSYQLIFTGLATNVFIDTDVIPGTNYFYQLTGRRVTFYYYEVVGKCNPDDEISLCALPRYQAPPGVTAKLRPVNKYGADLGGYDFFTRPTRWRDSGGETPFECFDFPGYILTLQDGTEFYIQRKLQGEFTFLSNDCDGQAAAYIGEPTSSGFYVEAYGKPYLAEIRQRGGDRIYFNRDEIGTFGQPNLRIQHFNASNQLTRSILIERDGQGRIAAISDPLGLNENGLPMGWPALKYEYDSAGNLAKVLKLVDRLTGAYLTNQYYYENSQFPHYITGIRDSRGKLVTRNEYDSLGRLTTIKNASDQTSRFEHDLANRREIQYGRSGAATQFKYDSRGNVLLVTDPLGHTNSFTYDDNGYRLTSTDALGRTTYYTNDADGNVLAVVLPHPPGADPAAYTTHFSYDQFGNQTRVQLPTGAVINNIYDPLTGNLIAVTDGENNLISSTEYDGNGLPKTETDQFGSLHYAYDGMGNLTFMTNSLGQVVESGYDLNGNLTTLVDNGQTNTISYDALNRETGADYGNNISVNYGFEGEGEWTTVSGPTLGNMERRLDDQGRLAGWETANGSSPGFAYDVNGRLQYETNSIGVVTYTVYDLAGRAVATTNLTTGAGNAYGYDAANQRVAVTNALGYFTRYAYNVDGSLAAMTDALQRQWLYDYDTGGACCGGGSTTTTMTDPLGRQTIDLRSAHGLPVATIWRSGMNVSSNYTEYLAGMTTEEQEAEEYPVAITDEGGRTRRYEYDEMGRLSRATDLSGATWWTNQFDAETGALTNVLSPTGEKLSYTYDDLDNVKTIKFGDGNSLTNLYNDANRLSGVWLPSGTLLTNFYDFAGRLTNRQAKINGVMTETASFEYNGNDAVTRMTDNTGGTTNRYDAAGRLWGIDYPSGASVRYQLDLLDRITAITNKATAGGTAYVTRYEYDSVGNITAVIDHWNRTNRFEYDRVGRRTKRTLANNIVTEWQYNWRDQVTNVIHKLGGATLASFTYERSAGGEPTKIAREDGSYVELQYDAALRLTNEVYRTSGGALIEQIGYGYDSAGSRIRLLKGGNTLTNAVSAGYRITQVKNGAAVVESYSYDNGGRVTGMTRDGATRSFGYNSADQLTAVTNGAAWTTYLHDANGRRTISTNSSGTVRRLLVAPTPGSDLESPLLVANASGTVQQGFVYLGDEPLLRFDAAGNAVYYLEDAMGSIAALADGSGNAIATFSYDGFGNFRSLSGSTNPPTGTGGDFRFHRAWLESDSGLYNMRARDYDPRLGRFTSRDNLNEGEFKEPESLNPYTFAYNNPHVYSDPSGQFTLIEISFSNLIGTINDLKAAVGSAVGRRMILKRMGKWTANQIISYLQTVLPIDEALISAIGTDPLQAGIEFQRMAENLICSYVPLPKDWLWLEPRVRGKDTALYKAGDVYSNGIGCGDRATARRPGGNIPRPDFIISPGTPRLDNGETRRGLLIGDFKLSGKAYLRSYGIPGPKKATQPGQWAAITGYASRHSYTRTVLLVSLRGMDKPTSKLLLKAGAEKGVLVLPVGILK